MKARRAQGATAKHLCPLVLFFLFDQTGQRATKGLNSRALQQKLSLDHRATKEVGPKCLNLRIP